MCEKMKWCVHQWSIGDVSLMQTLLYHYCIKEVITWSRCVSNVYIFLLVGPSLWWRFKAFLHLGYESIHRIFFLNCDGTYRERRLHECNCNIIAVVYTLSMYMLCVVWQLNAFQLYHATWREIVNIPLAGAVWGRGADIFKTDSTVGIGGRSAIPAASLSKQR